jgi:predicted 3-demethylubiquinone-9 3-methyltransferase (glyoxalase superfamily)
MPKVFPHLWFQNQAEEAMGFYTSVFKDSKSSPAPSFPTPSCRSSALSSPDNRSSR